MEGQDSAVSAQPGIAPMRPRGRPPADCIWVDGCYVNTVSGVPHYAAEDRELFVQRRRKYDRARYWNPAKNVRKSRLARSARKSGRPPKPIQLKLDEVASTAQPHSRQAVTIGRQRSLSPGLDYCPR